MGLFQKNKIEAEEIESIKCETVCRSRLKRDVGEPPLNAGELLIMSLPGNSHLVFGL